jgi:hypothetical protein
MRKVGLLVALVGAVVLALGAFVVPAVAGEQDTDATTLIVKKVVNGPATAGSTVKVQCTDSDEVATLTFDATGAPSTASSNSWAKVNGAWQLQTTLPEAATPCTYTETETGGAESTSWTCAYQSTEPDVVKGQGPAADPEPGCAAAAGTGTGPATVVYGNFDSDVETQSSTVTFTNTYVAPPAPPANTAPNFTG